MESEKQRLIKERAYRLWQAEGQPHGRHEEHWRRAAQEIEAEDAAEVALERKPRRASGRSTASKGRTALQRRKKARA